MWDRQQSSGLLGSGSLLKAACGCGLQQPADTPCTDSAVLVENVYFSLQLRKYDMLVTVIRSMAALLGAVPLLSGSYRRCLKMKGVAVPKLLEEGSPECC